MASSPVTDHLHIQRDQQGPSLQVQLTVVCLTWTVAAVVTHPMMKPKPDSSPPQCQHLILLTVLALVMALTSHHLTVKSIRQCDTRTQCHGNIHQIAICLQICRLNSIVTWGVQRRQHSHITHLWGTMEDPWVTVLGTVQVPPCSMDMDMVNTIWDPLVGQSQLRSFIQPQQQRAPQAALQWKTSIWPSSASRPA